METASLPSMVNDIHLANNVGFAHVPAAVDPELLTLILGEVDGLDYEPAPAEVNGVPQHYDQWTGRYPIDIAGKGFNHTIGLRQLLTEQARAAHQRYWWPNQVAVHRYSQGDLGIGPHRDNAHYLEYVAIVGLEGVADLRIYDQDRTTILETQPCGPGDVVWLLGKKDDGDDRRPIHGVSGGIDGPRTSITFRMSAPPRG